MERFLKRKVGAGGQDDVSTVEAAVAASERRFGRPRRRRGPLCSWQQQYETRGRCSVGMRHHFVRKLLSSYHPAGCSASMESRVELHNNVITIQKAHVSCISFNQEGSLVASASSRGLISLAPFHSLLSASTPISPLVEFFLGHRVEAMAWEEREKGGMLAVVASDMLDIPIFDVSNIRHPSPHHLQQPLMTLKRHGNLAELLQGRGKGHHDVRFLNSMPLVMAAAEKGDVVAWDLRVGGWKQPCAVLRPSTVATPLSLPSHLPHSSSSSSSSFTFISPSPTSSIPSSSLLSRSAALDTAPAPLTSLELSADERVVLAGSRSGMLFSWDMRGGRQAASAAAFGNLNEAYHPPLSATSLTHHLKSVPSLEEQAGISCSSIQTIRRDPQHEHHLAFHLTNGWSGVFDLAAGTISHLHCPPSPPLNIDDDLDWDLRVLVRVHFRRRQPAWLLEDSVFCVPSATSQALHLLDFSCSSPHGIEHDTSSTKPSMGERAFVPQVETEGFIVCVAPHPSSRDIVCGSWDGSLLTLTPGWHES